MAHEKLTVTFPSMMPNRVVAIKALRTLSGYGLKESKDMSEAANQPFTFDIEMSNFFGYSDPQKEVEMQCQLLRAQGVIVGAPVFRILDDLRKLGSEALIQGEDELANEILQLVLAEKLRRKP